MKIGFLIIDMQTIHLQDLEKKIIDRACEYINYVSDLLRSNDHVVIHVQDIEGLKESNRDLYNSIPEIQIKDEDLILTKENSNAFWKTELEQILLNQSIELIIISGFAAEHCVLFTYNGAIERGFKPVILQNGILSNKSDVITSTYRDRNLISYPVIEYLITN
ncbi:Nicotinamidase-related amidase [Paenibacillus sophorae]|uniref:Isochorismatase family protein n=1 Tax=Paenibacillus sophorae TaxID=1333845 RepID=A0A1H8Q154_9BACL|nr:isochorismatase family protein [Paenibacillus sophorae]QWU15323.1 isochorismatase family protein [Paenibacillus sophorae]SEO47513.1 Nicotinamidase-related amidase [Paenibacillus sophorae]